MAISRDKFFAHHPTLIGVVAGVSFYEHPIYGDEAGMIADYDGKLVKTDWYDLPEPDDIGDVAEFMELYA